MRSRQVSNSFKPFYSQSKYLRRRLIASEVVNEPGTISYLVHWPYQNKVLHSAHRLYSGT
jgi:hypothetical protein